MHHSRLSAILIDCRKDTMEAGVEFWREALGFPEAKPEDERYVTFGRRDGGLEISLQRVDEPSAIHLDIESDDVEAEADRLEALGAKRIRKIKSWWVMEAPTGHRFCVIRAQTPDLSEKGNAWD